jgi:hypothetical protein
VLLSLDVVIEPDPAFLALGEDVEPGSPAQLAMYHSPVLPRPMVLAIVRGV